MEPPHLRFHETRQTKVAHSPVPKSHTTDMKLHDVNKEFEFETVCESPEFFTPKCQSHDMKIYNQLWTLCVRRICVRTFFYTSEVNSYSSMHMNNLIIFLASVRTRSYQFCLVLFLIWNFAAFLDLSLIHLSCIYRYYHLIVLIKTIISSTRLVWHYRP